MTGRKMVPELILEGTRLTQKTELAFALNEHPRVVGPRRYRYHSPVISAEWCAFTNTPWGRGLLNYEAEEAALARETYETWVRLFELQRYYSWIVDRFHLSTRMHQRMHRGVEVDFRWLEERLRPLNFRLVFVHRSPASFARAREARLEVSGNPGQYDDLERFVHEQEVMRDLASESLLETLHVDVSDSDVAGAADRIADWLASTSGLYLDDVPVERR